MEPEQKSNGALVGLVIIIIILVVGGIYIWIANQKALQEKKLLQEKITAQDTLDLSKLEADVNSIDINLGVDVKTIK